MAVTVAGDPGPAGAGYEGLWALLGIVVVLAVHAGPVLEHLPGRIRQVGTWAANRETLGEPVARGRLRFGYLFLAALVWWLVGRIGIAFLWRDEAVLGPLDMDRWRPSSSCWWSSSACWWPASANRGRWPPRSAGASGTAAGACAEASQIPSQVRAAPRTAPGR